MRGVPTYVWEHLALDLKSISVVFLFSSDLVTPYSAFFVQCSHLHVQTVSAFSLCLYTAQPELIYYTFDILISNPPHC